MNSPEVPRVFVVAGAAGSGKTTFGRALARAVDASLLDQDVLTNPLLAQLARALGIAVDDLDHPALGGPVRRARYRCVLDAALDNLAVGRSTVLVAPFTAEVTGADAWAEAFRSFAPTPVLLVWVSVPSEVARDRRRSRGLPRDRAAAPVGRTRASVLPARPHIAVDGAAPTDSEVARVLAASWPGRPSTPSR